jgi:predicted membrane chloride channel (bestrophin family)
MCRRRCFSRPGRAWETGCARGGWTPAGGHDGEPPGRAHRLRGGLRAHCQHAHPFAYTLLLHRTAYIYCFLLPFGLVDTLHGLTPLVVGLVAYTFFGLDALGDEIEDPFGTKLNHLPLDALCVTIETSLREALGETDLPHRPRPSATC